MKIFPRPTEITETTECIKLPLLGNCKAAFELITFLKDIKGDPIKYRMEETIVKNHLDILI
jgi:hypothetical protein